MKERPILFSAPMILAILDGTKTQTRRIVKPHKDASFGIELAPCELAGETNGGDYRYCPYGQPGDRLWVRETWRIGAWSEDSGSIAIDYQADGSNRREWLEVPDGDDFLRYWQQSTDDAIKFFGDQDKYKWEPGQSPCRWRPSIHMPRFASRITLEITGVRVERLNDISEEDARAEGITDGGCLNCGNSETDCGCLNPQPDARDSFIRLWQSINGPDSWAANHWVWIVEFKRLEQPA
jgi:hypothetical protein